MVPIRAAPPEIWTAPPGRACTNQPNVFFGQPWESNSPPCPRQATTPAASGMVFIYWRRGTGQRPLGGPLRSQIYQSIKIYSRSEIKQLLAFERAIAARLVNASGSCCSFRHFFYGFSISTCTLLSLYVIIINLIAVSLD